ncbi:MAG TPA: nitrophenyl compound nitroreductase subunit ArsF family protein [Phycisphaerae bacterium]|nr:nitrophenyl compound nitroreductase subunit ArsF family protein [Phycisphaerae bacterium]
MKPRTILTAVLLVFVAVSVGYLIAKEAGRNPPPGPEDQAPAVSRETSDQETAPASTHKVLAYYFHGNVRCSTCRKIEAYTQEAIEGTLAEALKDGRLEWQVVNVDHPINEHFVQDYQLFTRSVVVVGTRDGKQVRWKNLERIWDLVHDKGAFVNYIQDEVRAYLGGEE